MSTIAVRYYKRITRISGLFCRVYGSVTSRLTYWPQVAGVPTSRRFLKIVPPHFATPTIISPEYQFIINFQPESAVIINTLLIAINTLCKFSYGVVPQVPSEVGEARRAFKADTRSANAHGHGAHANGGGRALYSA